MMESMGKPEAAMEGNGDNEATKEPNHETSDREGDDAVPVHEDEQELNDAPISNHDDMLKTEEIATALSALAVDAASTDALASQRSSHADLRDSPRYAATRSQPATPRLDLAVEDAAEHKTIARDASAFQTWMSSTPADVSPYQIGPFVLLLLDEFCRHYALTATASALQNELQLLGVEIPESNLWFDMYGQCSSILTNKKLTDPLAPATTIERLVEFCVTPQTQRAVLSHDIVAAHSPMRVCASPKRVSSTSTPTGAGFSSLMTAYQQLRSPIVRPSHRPSSISINLPPPPPIDNESEGPQDKDQSMISPSHSPVRKSSVMSMPKKKKKKKPRQHRSHSVFSNASNTTHHAAQQPTPGTYGEPALVQTHLSELKRDLTSTRLLEKELRHVRLEKILTEPTISMQKKLGFYTLSPDERRTRQQLQDPYANELILEKYGFSKRQECALCQFPYLQFNLPHKVSFKCIMDVYDHWQYVPPDRATASKYKPPLCYDAVHVCRLCAQIVFQFAKQPEAQLLMAKAARPLSRKHKKVKSMARLHQAEPMEDASSFCSDPYALPPLLGDDVYDHRDTLSQNNTYGRRRGLRGDAEPSDGDGRVVGGSESPAKAMVYSQQIDGVPFMSAKEWDVINPNKSSTRHRMEASLAAAAAVPPSRGSRG